MKTTRKYNLFSTKVCVVCLLGIGAFTISCDSLLDEEPKTIVSENFYQNASDFDAATNAIYFPLRMVRSEQIAVLSAHTDWGYGRGSRAQYNDFDGFNPTNINAAASRWNSFYKGIRNANIVIEKAPLSEELTEDEMNGFIAEAKFLRALTYFDLVRNWGGVPLRTEQNISDKDVPKSSVEDVYSLILSDLEAAETGLPTAAAEPGRPTQWAAKTLLADVYLQLEEFDSAKLKAEEVIDSDAFQLVHVTSVDELREKIFGPTLISSSEEIFSFKFARQTGQGNGLPWILNHPSTGLYNFGGAYAHYGDASNPFYKEWEDGDLRKSLWQFVDFGLGDSTLVNGKYAEPQAVDNTGAGNDTPIYRYAELLLIYAEASAQVDGLTEENMDAVNQIRRRAFGLDPLEASSMDYTLEGLNTTEFLDLILQEKAYETQFEGKRWLDLKRTGRAEEFVMKNKGLSIADRHYLWPIPLEELNFNEAMSASDQNPGY
ncbi:RagB/SusD family nutrient uptake outer membrane protein [Algoriphagus halophytocola]|uniref:RagB/SusD family nutrient uptake outer membrane protein n=1 Tax=Algoriphagus halophytocola TaxID=2991499 RepID=A0ABY6MGI6_9BACT|nr:MULTISPECIES: RagB/SusD family nutrient uptake outer membrane protein [unclassified Algoriphagus]UZD22913.1 RagB/SusD family nutrient uptake outer membrane protein [Algoriphagus sp. TR-M5]WBL44181.1 RagB/SusD family nutrient uptake outer membrane protein [Algoriphagus sp. TR-M9]